MKTWVGLLGFGFFDLLFKENVRACGWIGVFITDLWLDGVGKGFRFLFWTVEGGKVLGFPHFFDDVPGVT